MISITEVRITWPDVGHWTDIEAFELRPGLTNPVLPISQLLTWCALMGGVDRTATHVRSVGWCRPLELGQVRADVIFEQALDMVVSIATIDGDGQYREPSLQILLDGVIPPPASGNEPPD